MSNITIVINTDNEATRRPNEIARILRSMAYDFDNHTNKDSYRDINGNTVASVNISIDGEDNE